MKGNQFMDGTPHVTQCPILPSAKFVMKFTAQGKIHLWRLIVLKSAKELF